MSRVLKILIPCSIRSHHTSEEHTLLKYNKWCQLQVHGKGVNLFQQYQSANSWKESRMGLSSTEWHDAIKLQGNLAPVRALHGRS